MKNIYENEDLTVCDYGSCVMLSEPLRVYLSDYPAKHNLIAHTHYKGNSDNEYAYVVADYCPTQRFSSNTLRMFTGLGLSKPNVCVLDIETTGLDGRKDKVEKIGMYFADDDYYILLDGEEEETLPLFVDLITLHNGLLVGHNIGEFDLPFLQTRWNRYRNLNDEDNSLPDFPFSKKEKRFRVGMEEKQIHVWKNNHIQVIDTYPLSQRLDVMLGGRVSGYGLKQLVYEWGLSDTKRTRNYFQAEDKLTYLLEDLADTNNLFWFATDWFYEILDFGSFTWDNVYDGLGSLVNQFFFSWLAFVQPIPKRQTEAEPYVGGYVDLLHVGYFENVHSIDVVSMYPNIMKRYTKPKWDTMGYFSAFVSNLLQVRLHYKKIKQEGKQKALKILINSMYGFLASGMNYSDAEEAKRVTEYGRNIIGKMRDIIIRFGGTVLEMDTDGIYFQHTEPEKIKEAVEAETGFETELSSYDAGLFVKKKNYCLFRGNEIILKGNSLRSRRDNSIYRHIVEGIVRAYQTPNPAEKIKQLWDEAWREYVMYDLKTLPKAWYVGVGELERKPPQNIAERLDRIEKLCNVFLRFDVLPEIQQIFAGENRRTWRKRINAELQLPIFSEVV